MHTYKHKGTFMDYQTYQIALSPDLDITPEEFAAAWNENAEARALAEAHLSEAKGAQFLDPMLVTVLLSVGTGLAGNLLTDIIEGVVQQLRSKKGKQSSTSTTIHKHTHIENVKLPDGSEMLVVDKDES
jgi:hypothetical protein